MSIEFYDRNAQAYFVDTVNVDMSEVRARFLTGLPAAAMILDAGCGSGRDASAFHKAGHNVTAFDASAEMVRLARAYTGLEVQQLTFEEVHWLEAFDGVWANASLLHVAAAHLQGAVAQLAGALRAGGSLYVSLKLGDGERDVGGQRFTDTTVRSMEQLLTRAHLEPAELWLSKDVRPHRSETWVNAIGRKAVGATQAHATACFLQAS